MENIQQLFKFLFFPLFFFLHKRNQYRYKRKIIFYFLLLFTFIPFGLNAADYTCPGEDVLNIHDATSDAYQTYSENSTGSDKKRYFKFRTQIDGTITISFTSDRKQRMEIGTSCDDGDIYYPNDTTQKSDSYTFNVSAGTWYYINMKERNPQNKLRFTIIFDFTATATSGNTIWIKNTDNTSAYTDPSPYENYSDATETLSIPGATSLNVTISGTVEYEDDCSYDYVRIADSDGNAKTFCGAINETYTVPGDTISLYFHSDYSVVESGVTVSISAVIVNADAEDDSYTTTIDTVLSVPSSNGLLANDSGNNIVITGLDTSTLTGTINTYDASTGSFTFTPESGFNGLTQFTYTIRDDSGNIDTAIVTINVVVETEFEADSHLGFEQLNPQSTQNVIGNYLMTGNTVLCLTNKSSGYPDDTYICQDSTNIGYYDSTSNNYVAKYIDIDDDSSTWNSSSANITLPDSYEQNGGNGILWAGLVWQGRFAWEPYVQELHYYTEGASSPIEHETGDDTGVRGVNIDSDAHVNLIRLKIDEGTYQQVQAYKVYSKTAYDGVTYSAVANITSLLRNANLAKGDHTFTIGNLPTSEGRENSPGIYGGWSIVVIYAEDILVGKPRNITIYGGMLEMSNSETTVEISGFKLPSSGNTVTAQLSLFSGEGEHDYSPDGVDIGLSSSGPWTAIPETGNNDNVFDAVLSNVNRDHIDGKYNDLQNNNTGIDVDVFDISNIVSDFSRDTTSFWLRMWAREYVVPGMLAFSTELYQPSMCYDYTLEVGGYVIPSENNIIDTTIGAYTYDPMVTRVSIQSKEGDFDFHDVNMTYVIADTNQTQYISGTTELAKNNQFAYVDASDQTTNETSKGFLIYLGEGASANTGGTIKAYEKRFIKWKNTIDSNVDTQFSLVVQYTVDYGSGPVPIAKLLTEEDYCRDGGGYFIASDIFNVTSANADPNTGQPYNLYTQVVNKPFDVDVFSHDIDHINDDHRLKAADTAVEVEIYDAEWFPRDVNLSCLTPDSNKSAPIFVDFNNQTSESLSNFSVSNAISNAGFRVWYLHRPDGSLVSHHCTSRTDQSCFRTVWETELAPYATADRNCTDACNASTGCYSCMKRYYGQPVCSKDNFAIRPEAFVVELRDNQQSTQASATPITNIAHSVTQNQANAVAGYQYRFDINATNYLNDGAVRGYYRTFDSQSTAYTSKMQLKNKTTLINDNRCNDFNDKPVGFTIYNGTNVNYLRDEAENGQIEQVGLYEFNITDSNWTVVDWHSAKTTHHNAPGFDTNNPYDCVLNSDVVTNTQTDKVGCEIRNNHIHPNGTTYNMLEVNFYPYQFNTALGISPEIVTANMVYMNTIHPTKIVPTVYQNIPDQNMSFNIVGDITATGYDGNETLSNFVNGCFSRDVNMILRHQYLSPLPDTTTENISFAYDMTDMNKTNPGTIVLPRKRVDLNTTYSASNTFKNVTIMQDGNITFSKDMQGSIYMDLGFNFDRTINQPVNPRYIWISDFNLTLTNQPSVLNVNTITNYKVYTNVRVDQNISFAYARSKPGKYFYDDITANSVITPISVEVYCDLGYKTCAQHGIDVNNGQTNDARWWKVIAHDNVGRQDGRIALQTDNSNATVSSPVLISNSNGQDSSVSVGYTGTTKPATISITHILPPATNYTDVWLLYNEFNASTAPTPFYRVRFIDNAVWSGVGKTGNVVGTGAASKKTQRMDW